MGTCKGCGEVFGVLEMRDGYCNNCIPFEYSDTSWRIQKQQYKQDKEEAKIQDKKAFKELFIVIVFATISSLLIGYIWGMEIAITYAAGYAFIVGRILNFSFSK